MGQQHQLTTEEQTKLDNEKFKQIVDQQFYKFLRKRNLTKQYIGNTINYPINARVEKKLKRLIKDKINTIQPITVKDIINVIYKCYENEKLTEPQNYSAYTLQAFDFYKTKERYLWNRLTMLWQARLIILYKKYYGKL